MQNRLRTVLGGAHLELSAEDVETSLHLLNQDYLSEDSKGGRLKTLTLCMNMEGHHKEDPCILYNLRGMLA